MSKDAIKKPWKPCMHQKFWFVHLQCGKFHVDWALYLNDDTDHELMRARNMFRTKGMARAAAMDLQHKLKVWGRYGN
ncbi:MAG: hypothetical protein ACM3QX_18405 [Syntrophomonadaceae bacterium]